MGLCIKMDIETQVQGTVFKCGLWGAGSGVGRGRHFKGLQRHTVRDFLF